MKITLDFENETLTDEHGTIMVPGLKAKEDAILGMIGVEKMDGVEMAKDIQALMDELGFGVKVGNE